MQPSTRTGMTAGVTEKENKLVPRNIIVGKYRFSKKKGVTSHIFFSIQYHKLLKALLIFLADDFCLFFCLLAITQFKIW